MDANEATVHGDARLTDLRNLAIIVVGWLILALLLPPKDEYPVIDDGWYADSVRVMLERGQYIEPAMTQPNLVGLTVWGMVWSKVLGFSFNTLATSTLALSLAGLMAFYGLARAVHVVPGAALLGTALLAFNPIFLHLSYSFMTDVPCVALMLIAAFCYVRGIEAQRFGPAWIFIGSLFALWAFFVRQYGIIVPIAFFLYLLLLGLFARKWHWRKIVALVVPCGVVLLIWYVSESQTPPSTGALYAASSTSRFLFKEPWPRVVVLKTLFLLPVVALSAWVAIKIRWPRWWLIPPVAAFVWWGLANLVLPGESWTLGSNQGPATFGIGDLTVTFPAEFYTFGSLGNIIRVTGIDLFQYNQEAVLSAEAWNSLWKIGIVLGVLLLAKIADALLDWLPKLFRREWSLVLTPVIACHIAGAGLFLATTAFTSDVFDRYMITFFPFVLLFVIRGAAKWKRLAWAYSIGTVLAIMVFSYMSQADFVDHNNARWKAGYWLKARIEPALVGGGWDWNNWVNAGQGNNAYIITDLPFAGMRTDRTFAYFSRLGGFTTRNVLVQFSPDVPPPRNLPEDASPP